MSERSRTGEPRTATFETRHADAAAARTVAAALAPDNTPQIRTEADGDVVRTRIERDTTGGLHASADDYLVNVVAADAVVASARSPGDGDGQVDADDGDVDRPTGTGGRSDTDERNGTDERSDTNEHSDTNDTHE